MIRIRPINPGDLPKSPGETFPEAVQALAPAPEGELATAPSVELSYDEIEAEEVDRVFGYCQIGEANGPVGIPGLKAPLEGAVYLFFPLDGFQAYLRALHPEIWSSWETLGGIDELVRQRGDDLSATDHLVGGLFEIIAYCEKHQLVMRIRW